MFEFLDYETIVILQSLVENEKWFVKWKKLIFGHSNYILKTLKMTRSTELRETVHFRNPIVIETGVVTINDIIFIGHRSSCHVRLRVTPTNELTRLIDLIYSSCFEKDRSKKTQNKVDRSLIVKLYMGYIGDCEVDGESGTKFRDTVAYPDYIKLWLPKTIILKNSKFQNMRLQFMQCLPNKVSVRCNSILCDDNCWKQYLMVKSHRT
jgi:hypothetical protein